MNRHHLKSIAVFAALVASTACLKSDVTETWYVDAGGAVTWVVHEQNVRSDAQSPVDRRNEESEYWLAVQQGRHAMAEGLRELGAAKIKTVVLRGEVPYAVQTEARFAGLDVLGERLIGAVGGTGTSVVRRHEGVWEWTLLLRDPFASDTTGEPSDGIGALVNSLDHLKVVLADGRFQSAMGFDLSDDRRIARFNYKEPQAESSADSAITLKLVWK